MNRDPASSPSNMSRPAVMILIACSLKGQKCLRTTWGVAILVGGIVLLFEYAVNAILYRSSESEFRLGRERSGILRQESKDCNCIFYYNLLAIATLEII